MTLPRTMYTLNPRLDMTLCLRKRTQQSSTLVQELAKADLRRKRLERDTSMKATNALESMARYIITIKPTFEPETLTPRSLILTGVNGKVMEGLSNNDDEQMIKVM
jgi:hypothetical protein